MAESIILEFTLSGRPFKSVVDKTPFVIGRLEECDLALPEGLGISRKHCQLEQRGLQYWLRDLDSHNGIFCNKQKVDELLLEPNTVFQVGSLEVVFKNYGQNRLAERVHEELFKYPEVLEQLDLSPEAMQKTHQELVKRIQRDLLPRIDSQLLIADSAQERELLCREVADFALGYGPLEDLLKDEMITDILVNAHDTIYIERQGKLERSTKKFANDRQVLHVIRRIIGEVNRRINESEPMVDARLRDGSRINAVIPPISRTPTLSIRKFSRQPLRVEMLLARHSLSEEMAKFLAACVQARKSICVSGGTGAGKTTLLNILAQWIPHHERVIVIEDTSELRFEHPNTVSLEAKMPNLEGKGGIPIRGLVRNALRMRPDRVVIGECRGQEAFEMLQAMNTGHDGSLATIHASSCQEAMSRLENMVLMGEELPLTAIRRQVAQALDLVVQIARFRDGTRKLVSICEVLGIEEGELALQEIFAFRQTGLDDRGVVQGEFLATGAIPRFYSDLAERGVSLDLSIFA